MLNHLRIKALFVRAKGIEPIRLSAPDPKSGLSTNFNTPATVFLLLSLTKGLQMYDILLNLQNYQKQIPSRMLKLMAILGL